MEVLKALSDIVEVLLLVAIVLNLSKINEKLAKKGL